MIQVNHGAVTLDRLMDRDAATCAAARVVQKPLLHVALATLRDNVPAFSGGIGLGQQRARIVVVTNRNLKRDTGLPGFACFAKCAIDSLGVLVHVTTKCSDVLAPSQDWF